MTTHKLEAKKQKFLLAPAPAPLPGPLHSERDIALHRRLYCNHYDGCLDHSVRAGWSGFTCLHCPLRAHAGAGPGSEPFAHQRRAENLNQ